ncbi:hypothetical protein IBL26_18885 [Roseomonas aerophila]|uniref:Uncharacterized protein n=1 Tax=Teichococcus aerophilus TaxID=1224513 RepID=A0ABR7RQN0_9PROT|nr:hypothetical protein [Pseudoroseomonas aerophila]MBC9208920.1 hypothetical protein [Pseudoroseomonas aerophila]
MALSDEEKRDINDQIRAIIRRSSVRGPNDSPETVATLMVLAVCRELGLAHEDVPAALLRGLTQWGDTEPQ